MADINIMCTYNYFSFKGSGWTWLKTVSETVEHLYAS